ncbi:MAG: non-canonical purine NTP pyrophosphatase [Verrucomicrobiae bacterium]|nr:non-canonical purine NTP pyrophosphatase [Verrucomicrobiae bacterium]
MLTLFVATRNRHKTQEIAAILGAAARVRDLAALPGAPAAVEDASTFEGNATQKAAVLADWLLQEGLAHLQPPGPWFALGDDSGLEVDALNGAPGVASARFAAVDDTTGQAPSLANTPDADNNAKLLRLLAAVPWEQRTARFRCALALAPVSRGREPGEIRVFTGKCEGRIGFAPRGKHGFGYDPLFFPLGHDQSFAELGEDIKNRLSHRAHALAALRNFLQGQGWL